MNKKLIVPFLATIIGLSVAGGLGGAFAWYQFNAEVRTGFIGSSVAESGVLEIGYLNNNSEMVWGSDRYLNDTTVAAKPLVPVTFGQLRYGDALPTDSSGLKAWGYPEAGGQRKDSGYTQGWKRMVANQDGFYQYDIYLRAKQYDEVQGQNKLVSQAVFISSVTLEDASSNKTVSDALRVHISVDDGASNYLIANHEHKYDADAEKNTALDCYGKLDLDTKPGADTYDDEPWHTPDVGGLYGVECVYGVSGEIQETTQAYDDNTKGITGIVQPRKDGGLMPDPDDPNTDPAEAGKCICRTKTTGTVKLTITVWLEGWETLNSTAAENYNKAMWNPSNQSGFDVHVGLVFDVGRNILR